MPSRSCTPSVPTRSRSSRRTPTSHRSSCTCASTDAHVYGFGDAKTPETLPERLHAFPRPQPTAGAEWSGGRRRRRRPSRRMSKRAITRAPSGYPPCPHDDAGRGEGRRAPRNEHDRPLRPPRRRRPPRGRRPRGRIPPAPTVCHPGTRLPGLSCAPTPSRQAPPRGAVEGAADDPAGHGWARSATTSRTSPRSTRATRLRQAGASSSRPPTSSRCATGLLRTMAVRDRRGLRTPSGTGATSGNPLTVACTMKLTDTGAERRLGTP